jgi:DNA-binding NarL/FixJ family response regulator
MTTPMSPAESARRPSLMIADDDAVIRLMLARQLEDRFELVGFAANAEEAIALADDRRPDAALIDVEMPAGGGLRATREIHLRAPHTAIVILSIDEERESVLGLLRAGAMSYCRKGDSVEALASILVDSIAAHERAATDQS